MSYGGSTQLRFLVARTSPMRDGLKAQNGAVNLIKRIPVDALSNLSQRRNCTIECEEGRR